MVFSLADFKKQYAGLARTYKLPSFDALNEDFEIDKIDRETLCALRLIRKVIMEKVVNTLNFLEMLINPVNTPRVYLPYIRAMSAEDRKEVERIYSALGAVSIASLEVEVDYSEKKEAEIIRKTHATWQQLKPGLRTLLKHMQQPNGAGNSAAAKKEKSYFG